MTLTLGLIMVFFWVSLLFYVLFGGADFGGGLIELFAGKTHREAQRPIISAAMAPVWEANHIWLILAIVITFMGFPRVYTMLSIYLHLPMIAVLMGIVARGAAFTFRHYDTMDDSLLPAYNRAFTWSSLWTSFFLGIVAASMTYGSINPTGSSYYELYVASWLHPFAMVMGVFSCALFAFLAAAYLVGETRDESVRALFRRQAAIAQIVMVVAGTAVFGVASWQGHPLVKDFFTNPFCLFCLALATGLLWPFWNTLRRGQSAWATRILGAAMVTAVLAGWFAAQFPFVLRVNTLSGLLGLSYVELSAPDATLQALLGALCVGSLLIFPCLFILMRIFKARPEGETVH